MSRNKVLLLIGFLLALYMLLPNDGIYGVVKANVLAIAPYIMVVVIIYLLFTINFLKKALYRLSQEISEQNTVKVTSLLRIAFDVKRMIGTVNLINLYKRVNSSRSVSLEAKTDMYQVLRKKRIEVPLPSAGKK